MQLTIASPGTFHYVMKALLILSGTGAERSGIGQGDYMSGEDCKLFTYGRRAVLFRFLGIFLFFGFVFLLGSRREEGERKREEGEKEKRGR